MLSSARKPDPGAFRAECLGLDAARTGFVASLTAPIETPTITMPEEDLEGYTGRYSAPDAAYVLPPTYGRCVTRWVSIGHLLLLEG
jgi:hypothetical protein